MQTPNDCVLLLTVPLTRDDFLADLQEDSCKDFVRNWAKYQRFASSEKLTEAALWEIYSTRVVEFVLRSIDELEELGLNVQLNIKLEDLGRFFTEKKVVILEAHWFSPKFTDDDFYKPLQFVRNLYSSEKLISKALREILVFDKSDLSFVDDIEKERFSHLVRQINEIISSPNTGGHSTPPILITSDEGTAQEELRIQISRFELEDTFPEDIVSKCRVEMFDGLRPLKDLDGQIPRDFDGVIDFTVCNSESAGKFVKLSRSDCVVLTNRFTTDLKMRLILLKGVCKLLLSGDCETYIEAVFELRRRLLEL